MHKVTIPIAALFGFLNKLLNMLIKIKAIVTIVVALFASVLFERQRNHPILQPQGFEIISEQCFSNDFFFRAVSGIMNRIKLTLDFDQVLFCQLLLLFPLLFSKAMASSMTRPVAPGAVILHFVHCCWKLALWFFTLPGVVGTGLESSGHIGYMWPGSLVLEGLTTGSLLC